jgi:hypothetical protein
LNILISGVFPDIHTEAVAWGLRQKGIQVDIWNQANFPVQQAMSVRLGCEAGAQGSDWQMRDFSMDVRNRPYALVWYRRDADPTLSESINKADRAMAWRESRAMIQGMDQLLAQGARWVDDPHVTRQASSKVYQLQLAMQCGLSFPPTLFSNDPDEIRAFAAQHQPIVYKPFYQMSWKRSETSMRSLFTAKVRLEQLNNDVALRACPGIFQRCIEKDHEIRLTMLGDDHIALKIHSYPNERATVDWRSASTNGVKYDQVTLPDWLLERARRLMQALDIRFGCLDFIVDANGDYHFLEVNPSGQFLWAEYALPGTPMLDRFCDFLITEAGGTPPAGVTVSMPAFDAMKAANTALDAEVARHVAYANPFMHSEA